MACVGVFYAMCVEEFITVTNLVNFDVNRRVLNSLANDIG